MSRLLRILAFVASLSASGWLWACSQEPMAATADPLADVVYAGAATDEALRDLLAATPVPGSVRAPVLDTPPEIEMPGAVVALPAAPTPLTWHDGDLVDARPLPKKSSVHLHLADLLGVPAAFAHGAALSGKGYWLVVTDAKNARILRLFTTLTSWTPDAVAWQRLQAAGGNLAITVTMGVFDDNKLASDGGPFASKTVHFKVAN